MPAPEERCRGCGSALPDDARFCARCGRRRGEPAAPTLLELTPLAPASAPAEQRATVTTRPPARPRTLVVAGALVVLALVAFGVTRLLDDGDGGSDAAPLPSTTTIVPGAESTTSAAPTTTAVAGTSTSSATSTSTPGTTTTIPYVNQRRGVVLDAAQQDRSLYVANVNTVVRVDLGTGLVTTRDGLGGALGGALWATGGRLLVMSTPVRMIRSDLGGEVEERRLPGGFGVWQPDVTDAGGYWTLDYPESAGEPLRVRRYDLAGVQVDQRELPAGLTLHGFAGGRAVVGRAGRIWTMGPDARLVPYASGEVALVQNGWVLWVGCADSGRCTYHLGNATTPDTGRTSLETTYLYAYAGEGGGYAQALAPDGATVVSTVAVARDGLPRLVDLATGSVLETAAQGSPYFAWTPDGTWFVEVNGALVLAVNVRTGARRTLTVPGLNGAALTGVTIG